MFVANVRMYSCIVLLVYLIKRSRFCHQGLLNRVEGVKLVTYSLNTQHHN